MNYWTHQYGTRATLLGGTVIGSVLDLSGVYYNPGGVALIDDPEIILASKVFHYPNYTLKNLGRQNVRLNSSRLGPAPAIFAGLIPLGKTENHRLGYAGLGRYDVRLDLNSTLVDQYSVPNFNTVDVIFDFQLHEDLSEPWYGISWSYKLRKTVGIGVSMYATFRGHESSLGNITEFLTEDKKLFLAINTRHYKYNNYRLLWKLGATFNVIGLTFGITATTPSIGIYGDGYAGMNVTFIGGDLNQDGKQDTVIAATFQDNLKSNHPTPLSVAIGTTYNIKSTLFYLSAEWFSSVKEFDVLNTQDFYSQTGGRLIPFKITQKLKPVLNYGIGIEHYFGKNFSYYGSFTTDFSARDPEAGNLSVTSWNIYHLMTGANLRIKRIQFTLGVGYSFGSEKFQRSSVLDDQVEEILPPPVFENTKFDFRSFRFLFGFTF